MSHQSQSQLQFISDTNTNLDELINTKEEEIKKILNSKIIQLNKILVEKENLIISLQEKFDKLKSDYEFNYNLIEERDNDLKIYEEKIDTFLYFITNKDEEIEKLKISYDELNSKFQSEKIKRENNEELLKFNLAKNNSIHKEEIKNMSSILENLRLELKETKINSEDSKNLYERKIKEDSENFRSKFKILEKEIQEREEKINNLKLEYEDLKKNQNKTNNENLILIKEKIHLENKIKLFEGTESETSRNNSILTERNKFLLKEVEELKFEISSKNYKIENFIKIHEDLQNEIHSLKQKIQIKEFDYERKLQSEKNLNEKIREVNFNNEKLVEDKHKLTRELEEEKLKIQSIESKLKTQTDEMNRVKIVLENLEAEKKKNLQTIENLRKNLTMGINLENLAINSENNFENFKNVNNQNNPNYQNVSLLDFFNQPPQKKEKFSELLEEKEFEIQRLNKELEGAKNILNKAESDMQDAFQIFKENENKLTEKLNKLEIELIRKDLELKNSLMNSVNQNFLQSSKELNKDFNELKEANAKLKNSNEEKSILIKKLKQKILLREKEITRYKTERDKLSEICNYLRAEVNRIENVQIFNYEIQKSFSDENYPYHNSSCNYMNNIANQVNQNSITNTSNHNPININSNGFSDSNEFEEFKRKKNSILKEEKNSYEDVKKKIESVLNKATEFGTKRDFSNKSNGSVANSISSNKNLLKSPNLRKVQLDNINRHFSRSNSKSNSRSKSPDEKIFKDSIQIVKINYNKEERNHSSETELNKGNVNQKNLKLLKRNRIKFEDFE